MNESQNNRLQEIIDHGYEFKFGDYIGKAFSLFGKNVGGFMLFMFLFFMILLVCNLIPFLGMIGQILIPVPLLAGVYIVGNKLDKGEPTEFGDFF